MGLKWDDESRQTRVKVFTYDEQDGSSSNEVTFKALVYYPSGCVDIQSGQDLGRGASAPHHRKTAKEVGIRRPK
jgi:hypothetical protein